MSTMRMRAKETSVKKRNDLARHKTHVWRVFRLREYGHGVFYTGYRCDSCGEIGYRVP